MGECAAHSTLSNYSLLLAAPFAETLKVQFDEKHFHCATLLSLMTKHFNDTSKKKCVKNAFFTQSIYVFNKTDSHIV